MGREDKEKKPDICLDKDSNCSRETAVIKLHNSKDEDIFLVKHTGTCVFGYVINDKPFQLLDGSVIDIGGKLLGIIYISNISPNV